MTQSTEPSQITFNAMRDLFTQKFPDRVGPFDQVKPDLEAGKGAQALANLIGCEVEVRHEQGFSTYRWTGRSGPFEMKVPKPFDPAPQRPSEPQQQRQVQEPVEEPVELPGEAAPEQVEQSPPSEPEPAPLAATAQGLFAALATLLGESTLLMTVARTGEEGKEPVLTVTVVPQGETESFTPVCLTGSVSELDAYFVTALESKAESRKRLEQAVVDLKAADKELEEAKKVEAEAKRKQAASKKKAAEKKEDEKEPAKVEVALAEPPKPEPQEALF
jgi:PRTRC genetic system protein E